MEKRLLNVSEAMEYTGLGKNRLYDFSKEIGCLKKYGKRTLFDKDIIDKAIDENIGLEVVKGD